MKTRHAINCAVTFYNACVVARDRTWDWLQVSEYGLGTEDLWFETRGFQGEHSNYFW
jgi:hypothetical protein